jgi:sugar/nucleoside kinase (ribokinase family)
MKRYHVYGVGAALVDTEIDVSDQDLASMGVEKGLMTLVDEQRQQQLLQHLSGHLVQSKRASGGSAANTIIAVTQFGGRAFYSCHVADDDNGRFYRDGLQTAGVDCHPRLGQGTGITGKCLVLITPDAERSMNTFLGASADLSVADLDEEAIAASEYVYLEGYLVTSPHGRAAAIRAREVAERNGVKTALSFSDPGIVAHFRDGLAQMLGTRIDLLFCNRHEALSWAGTDDLEQAIAALKQIANTFAITLGAEGALAYDGTTLHAIAPFPVKAVDTNGAGDMFAGAFLYGITQGYDFPTAGKLASLASAMVVADSAPRMPRVQQQQLLAQLGLNQR